MLTFSAATRAARCIVGSWSQSSNVIFHRTIVLQCPGGGPMNTRLSPPHRDLAINSAVLAALSTQQRSLLSTAQTLSESAKASATASSEAGEGDEKPKYKPLTKWQKRGYIFFGANMFALVIGRHVMSLYHFDTLCSTVRNIICSEGFVKWVSESSIHSIH